MRKMSAFVLILVALLAIIGSAVSVLAKTPGTNNSHPTIKNTLAHVYLHILTNPTVIAIAKAKVKGKAVPPGLGPSQFNNAYSISSLPNKGAGITIAIVDAYGNPNAQADLSKYDKTYGLPDTAIKVVYPQGKPVNNQGWALETNLDIQMAHAVAPSANIVLEAAASPTFANLLGAVKDAYTNQKATIVSMSFGSNEFASETGANNDGIFSTGNSKGVTFVASSGDSGVGAQYPAASPFVIAVGGTTLTTTDDTYVSESAWSGSGGGISAFEPRPTYQNGFNKYVKRGIPDVSMDADPNSGVAVYDSFGYGPSKGWFILGGTSVSAPMWAGILAIVDSARASHLKGANTELYSVAKAHYATDYHDITTGSNGSCGAICKAGTGYDYVTGLGSPVTSKLVPDLIAAP